MSATDASERLTEKAVKAYAGIEDARLREVLASLIRHVHGCVKEVRPTEQEWEFAWSFMKRMAEFTGDDRNEFLLLADVIGVSQLIEVIGHERSQSAVGFALVGPFCRANAPMRQRGESVVSADTAGDRVRITGRVYDLDSGKPVVGAALDVWQAATNGLYENQDETQPDYYGLQYDFQLKTGVSMMPKAPIPN
jgi:catechol 1,2-dioxygenase